MFLLNRYALVLGMSFEEEVLLDWGRILSYGSDVIQLSPESTVHLIEPVGKCARRSLTYAQR